MAIVNSNISICSIPADTSYYTQRPANTGADNRTYFSVLGSNIYTLAGNRSDVTIFENDILKITANADKSTGRPSMSTIKFYDVVTNTLVRTVYPQNDRECYMALGYDDEAQEAYLFLTGQFYYSGSWTEDPNAVCYNGVLGATTAERLKMYELISGSQLPEYTWKSIDSVSGKMGQFLFGTIKDDYINDGDPVYDAPRDHLGRLEGAVDLRNIIQIANVETPFMYAGELDKATITLDTSGTYPTVTLKFYKYMESSPCFYQSYFIYETPTYLGFLLDAENNAVKISTIHEYVNAGFTVYHYNTETMSGQEMHDLYLWFSNNYNTDEDDPTNTEPEPDPTDNPWEDTAITGLSTPTASAIDTGFTKMYKVSSTELQNLSAFLWSDSFVQNVKKFFSDPRQIIVALSIMPLSPDTGTAETIQAGGISTGISGLPLTSQYKLVTIGSLYIKKSKKSQFLNYPPYTNVVAHLPFVGEHSLDVNDIMGKTLTLKYLFDFLSGCCVAEIDVDGKPRYFFGGNSSIQIPTSSEDFSRVYSSILSSGSLVGSTLATIATKGMAAPALVGAASAALGNFISQSPTVEYASGGGSINGMLSCQSAYLTIELPNEKRAYRQNEFMGRPSYTRFLLDDLRGYTKVLSVHLEEMSCTKTEQSQIETELKNGVIIRDGSSTPEVTPTDERNSVIAFMKMRSENNVIGKTWDTGEEEELILKLEGSLVYNQSISRPKFTVEGDIRGYNYAYIPIFERFYYIEDITIDSGNIQTVTFSVDVLQSFKTDILASYAVVEKQQSQYNTYFNDNEVWTQQNKTVLTFPFLTDEGAETLFDRDLNSYILTVAGS